MREAWAQPKLQGRSVSGEPASTASLSTCCDVQRWITRCIHPCRAQKRRCRRRFDRGQHQEPRKRGGRMGRLGQAGGHWAYASTSHNFHAIGCKAPSNNGAADLGLCRVILLWCVLLSPCLSLFFSRKAPECNRRIIGTSSRL